MYLYRIYSYTAETYLVENVTVINTPNVCRLWEHQQTTDCTKKRMLITYGESDTKKNKLWYEEVLLLFAQLPKMANTL